MRFRHYPFAHVYNFRDLGGYRTYDGRETAYGVFFRSDSPHLMTVTDRDTVYGFGVRSVMSLQFAYELSVHPNPFLADTRFSCSNYPVFADFHEYAANVQLGTYKLLFDSIQTKQPIICAAIRTLIHVPHAAWYYCRIGSERSGLISALLLDVVGVTHDVIIADYTRTAIYAAPIIEQLLREIIVHFPDYSDQVYDIIWPRPETMQYFLFLLQQKYGNSEGYLRHIGITDGEITQLRTKFVVDASYGTS